MAADGQPLPRRAVEHAPRRPARRRALLGAEPRPFRRQAVASRRRRDGLDGMRGAGLSAAAASGRTAGRPGGGATLVATAVVDPRARRRRPARHAVGRDHPRRPVPLRRPWRQLAPQPRTLGTTRARPVVRRRLRPSRHPLHLRRPTRQSPPHCRGVLRRRLAEPRRRPQLDLHHQRHARRLHAAGAERGGGDPGPAPPGAVPGAPGVPLGAAPQRHLPFPRRRPALAGRGRRAVQLRLRRRRASAAAGHGLVRPGDQGRMPHSQGRPFRGHPHPRRRPQLRDPRARPARWPGLRPGLPPRPGHRPQRRAPGHGLDHRRPVA